MVGSSGGVTSKREARTITVEEAARRLGISRSAAYRCVHLGQIPALRLGGRFKVPVDALERMLQGETLAVAADD
jgi:excisionase family DNA binding protein